MSTDSDLIAREVERVGEVVPRWAHKGGEAGAHPRLEANGGATGDGVERWRDE
jgi:hypothetical protein